MGLCRTAVPLVGGSSRPLLLPPPGVEDQGEALGLWMPASFDRPAGDETDNESDYSIPVDVAVRACLRRAVEFGDINRAAPLDVEIGKDHAGERAHPQEEADHPIVERLGE